MNVAEDFRTIYCDPGEDFGLAQGVGTTLLGACTEKMWVQVRDVWDIINDPTNPDLPLNSAELLRDDVDEALLRLPVGRIVCEDFRIYPWAFKDLKWDRVRTARAIGALTFMCQLHEIPFVLQPAAIKEAALAAGAEELFLKPLHPNRHQNDATMHFVFYSATELMGLNLPVQLAGKELTPPPIGHHPI